MAQFKTEERGLPVRDWWTFYVYFMIIVNVSGFGTIVAPTDKSDMVGAIMMIVTLILVYTMGVSSLKRTTIKGLLAGLMMGALLGNTYAIALFEEGTDLYQGLFIRGITFIVASIAIGPFLTGRSIMSMRKEFA